MDGNPCEFVMLLRHSNPDGGGFNPHFFIMSYPKNHWTSKQSIFYATKTPPTFAGAQRCSYLEGV